MIHLWKTIIKNLSKKKRHPNKKQLKKCIKKNQDMRVKHSAS